MAQEAEKRVLRLIAQGKTKKEIYHILSKDMQVDDFERFLRNQTELSKKEAYYGWNYLLLALLAAFTFIRLGEILGPILDHGVKNVFIVVWSLIVPAVNLCLLWYIYRFHRLGYLFLFVVSVLALFRPETHNLVGLIKTASLIFLSGFLYLKLFPKHGKNYF